MLVCHCTLPYSDPDACKNCSTYQNYNKQNTAPEEWDWFPYEGSAIPGTFDFEEYQEIKRIVRTIEKFDENGKYLGKEIITEEEQIIQQPKWETAITTTASYIGDSNFEVSVGTVTYDQSAPWTYTSCSSGHQN